MEEQNEELTPEQIAARRSTDAVAAQHQARIEQLLKEEDAFKDLCVLIDAKLAAGLSFDSLARMCSGMAVRLSMNFAINVANQVASDVPEILARHHKQQRAQASVAEQQRQANLDEVRRRRHH
ncbi:MAG: hypothetical protein ACYC8W_10890 [Candidatus Tyrphobacter sp.]